MLERKLFCLWLLLSPILGIAQTRTAEPRVSEAAVPLRLSEGWDLQASTKVEEKGERLSTPGYQTRGWYPVEVPTTVVAALVKRKVYPDPGFGMNLRSFPGLSYPIGANFSNLAMPPDSPFGVSWWYRKQFSVPADYRGKTIWLHFGGINYRANIWLNGRQIANSDDVAGAWRTYEFNITEAAIPGKNNALAVQVYAPTETDLAITFVDWNPAPPDKNMGLWRGVEVSTSGPVAVRYPTVISKVDSPANEEAHLTVTALVKNATNQAVQGTLMGTIETVQFSESVELQPHEAKNVVFSPAQFAQLNFEHPRLWWPKQMGAPNLYRLRMQFTVDGKISDRSETRFGVRQITSELNPNNHRVFSVNGKKILIRGGGWSPDMLLREDSRRLHDEFAYVEDMGLNTVRLEGKLEAPEFFDLADERGILVMAGWCCCDHWEHWPKWKPADFAIAQQSLRDQIYRLRSHPSLLLWLNGSDNPPPPDVEQTYLDVESELSWPNPVISSATARATSVTGESGVKMTGPYEYVAPAYWLQDNRSTQPGHQCNPGGCGGAYGFNTETSMGPAVPPVESLRAMLPKDHQWPIDEYWNYHAGGGAFKDLHVFTAALSARYGTASSLDDYALKAQLQSYEGVRAMFEAYSREKYTSTGVIQWMLNNAWPSMIWHLYDFYLRPGGGYFGAKKAMEPLHAIYGYDDRSIAVVSSQYEDTPGLQLTVKMLNLDMTEKFAQQVSIDVPADGVVKVLTLPAPEGLTPTYFVWLRLQDSRGKPLSTNFYWLSTKQETLDWEKSNWYTTPTDSYADFTALAQLPKVKLKIAERTEQNGETAITRVAVENPSQSLALFVRLKLSHAGEEILPVLWEDNYISLLPGEKRELRASYRASQLKGAKPLVEASGWNLQ
jgi:exo-1,4-beta-D-glucosaminidase